MQDNLSERLENAHNYSYEENYGAWVIHTCV